MNVESFRNYCLAKPGVAEDFPFDEHVLTFKVMGKIFALCAIDSFEFINLKCDPEQSSELREQYDAIKPGYHMNKKHWNSVYIDGTVPDDLVRKLTDHSYSLVVESLPKKTKALLNGQ